MNNLNRDFNTLNQTKNMTSYDVAGRSSVAGLFPSREQAIKAVNELKNLGFKDEQIGLITRDRNESNELIDYRQDDPSHNAAKGAWGGTLLGGLVGLLLGTGALMIPGIGPVVAGGLFASSAAGMTALGAGAGAAGGALLGALTDIGIADDEARYFESGFRTGSTLVTVKATDRLNEALEIIVRNGGDVGSYYRTGSYSAPVNKSIDSTTGKRIDSHIDNNHIDKTMDFDKDKFHNDKTIQLKEEELKINKERQRAGEVIVNKEVVEEQKRVEVPVMREEVIIERHKVNRPVEGGHISNESEEIRVPLMEERVNVDKQTFVTEEISVGKKQVQETKVVNETLRKEKANFETTGHTTTRHTDIDSDLDMNSRNDFRK